MGLQCIRTSVAFCPDSHLVHYCSLQFLRINEHRKDADKHHMVLLPNDVKFPRRHGRLWPPKVNYALDKLVLPFRRKESLSAAASWVLIVHIMRMARHLSR